MKSKNAQKQIWVIQLINLLVHILLIRYDVNKRYKDMIIPFLAGLSDALIIGLIGMVIL